MYSHEDGNYVHFCKGSNSKSPFVVAGTWSNCDKCVCLGRLESRLLGRRLGMASLGLVKMVAETITPVVTSMLTPTVLPFAESTLVGYIMGFAMKKILKWLLIILGVIAGIIFIAVQWMSQNGYVGSVKWDKLGNDMGQHLATQVDFTNLHGMFHYLGIPVTSEHYDRGRPVKFANGHSAKYHAAKQKHTVQIRSVPYEMRMFII